LRVILRELHIDRSKVLFDAGDLCGARNGNDPMLLCQQPRQRNLRGRSAFALGFCLHGMHEYHVSFSSLWREAWNLVAEVAWIELGVLVDLPSQEASPERAERYEPDSKLFEHGQDIVFRSAPKERGFALQRMLELEVLKVRRTSERPDENSASFSLFDFSCPDRGQLIAVRNVTQNMLSNKTPTRLSCEKFPCK
jgi:hypothetical protein